MPIPANWVKGDNFLKQAEAAAEMEPKIRADLFDMIDEMEAIGATVFLTGHDHITFEIPESRQEEFNDLVRRHGGSGSETP